jgi:hypothetical protein
MKFFKLYQYLVPIFLFPASYYLWLRQFDHNHRFVLLVLSIPILFAYIIPGLGTIWLKLWEFNTRFRLGRFRPHHGFVFGTATSLLALLTAPALTASFTIWEALRAAFILGSVLAFWNWWYDILAIKAGFIVVYNRPYAQNLGPEAIVTDYAPVLFGGFGCCYGLVIHLNQYYLLELGRWDYYWWLAIGGNMAALVIPVAAFVAWSYLRNGLTGLKSYSNNSLQN